MQSVNKDRYNSIKDADWAIKFLFFIMCPFLSFIMALKDPRSRSSYAIFFLFGVIFCWNMSSRETERYDDFMGISERFKGTELTTDELVNDFVKVITLDNDAPKEFYERALTWFTKLITNNYHLYFALAAVFYLTFMLGSLKQITSDKKFQVGFYGLLILALYVMPRDIITVQNPRFTTGFWLNVMCTQIFFLNRAGNKSTNNLLYAIPIFLSPLIHSGMWPYVGIFLMGCLVVYSNISIRFLTIVYYVVMPISLVMYGVLSTINISSLPLPAVMSAWISRYMSEDFYNTFVVLEGSSGFWWISRIFDIAMKVAYALIPIILIRQYKKITSNIEDLRFFRFYLFFCAVVNLIQYIPVLGERYYWFVRVFSILLWFRIIYPKNNKYLLFLFFTCSDGLFRRYLYHGAVESCVPPGIWFEPLPLLIMDGLL